MGSSLPTEENYIHPDSYIYLQEYRHTRQNEQNFYCEAISSHTRVKHHIGQKTCGAILVLCMLSLNLLYISVSHHVSACPCPCFLACHCLNFSHKKGLGNPKLLILNPSNHNKIRRDVPFLTKSSNIENYPIIAILNPLHNIANIIYLLCNKSDIPQTLIFWS